MIPSKYLFPVVVLVLIWAASLFGVYHWATAPTVKESQLNFQLSLLVQTKETLTKYEDAAYLNFTDLLLQEDKEQFRPLLVFIENNRALREHFTQQFKSAFKQVDEQNFDPRHSDRVLETLDRQSEVTILKMVDQTVTSITSNAQVLELGPEQAQHLCEELKLQADQLLKAASPNPSPPPTFRKFETRAKAIELRFKLFEMEIQHQLLQIAGGKTLHCFSEYDFPVLAQPNAVGRVGHPLTLLIGAGQLNLKYKPENVSFLIAGKRYPMGEDGRLQYDQTPTNQKGWQTLPVTLIIKNPLTGLERTTNSEITYFVD